jgi:hypothetical protein
MHVLRMVCFLTTNKPFYKDYLIAIKEVFYHLLIIPYDFNRVIPFQHNSPFANLEWCEIWIKNVTSIVILISILIGSFYK